MTRLIRTSLLSALLAAVLCSCTPSTPSSQTAGHPPLSEQDMLIACQDCHAISTPQVHAQWHQSGHGIASVKCYQCHGTFEGLRAEPSLDACAVCHTGQWEHSDGKTCWQCHPAHTFEAGN